MKSIGRIIKRNIITILVIIVFIIGMVCLSYFKKLYWDDNGTAAYGDRTVGVSSHVISDEDIETIEKTIEELDGVVSAEYDLEGRIINLMIYVEDDVTIKEAKKIGESTLDCFSSDELSYYSVQVYCMKEDSSQDDFPIVGYKHYSNSELSWTKDREATSDESE